MIPEEALRKSGDAIDQLKRAERYSAASLFGPT
jgi:hypothetical protein